MSDGIRAIRAASGSAPSTRPPSARPIRPASARAPSTYLASSEKIIPRLRPFSARVSKSENQNQQEEGISVIESALKQITLHEKKSGGGNLAPSRPTSASQRIPPVFIPTRSLSTSPRRPQSPRKEILKTLNATRLGMEQGNAGDILSENLLLRVFKAKCLDLRLTPTDERKERFFEIVRKNSAKGQLSLRETGLGAFAAAAVAALLLEEPLYLRLDLGGNMLKDAGTIAIAELISQDYTLTSLDLRSNDIGIEGGTALFEAVKVNTTLTELDLGILAGGNRNRVGSKVAPIMKDTLRTNTVLTSLSLFGNGLGPEGCIAFANGLQSNTILKCLNIGLNSLKDDGIITLAPALELAALESLNIAQNVIGTRGIKCLSQVLSSGKLLLQTLDLSSNSIGPVAAGALGVALCANSLLCTLHLDRTDLGADGAVALSVGLGSLSLSLLTLTNNSIQDRGALALAKELRRNTALTKLDLSTNLISDNGATGIAQMMGMNTGLTNLNLADNAIGDSGGVLLSNALTSNETLRQLSLRGNKLHDVTGSALVAGLRGNTGLTELDVSWNDINYTNFRSIEKLIFDHASQYREGAVPRLNKELARLRKEEPKLAIREAELAEVTEERDRLLAEGKRLNQEVKATLMYTEQKLEETNQSLVDATNELNTRNAELKAVTEKYHTTEKQLSKDLSVLQSKVDRGESEIVRLKNELEHIRANIARELTEEEEVCADIEAQTEAVNAELSATQAALEQFRTKSAIFANGGNPSSPDKIAVDHAKGATGPGQTSARSGAMTNRSGKGGQNAGGKPSEGDALTRPASAARSRPASAKLPSRIQSGSKAKGSPKKGT